MQQSDHSEKIRSGHNTQLLFTSRNQYNTNEGFELTVGTVAPSSHTARTHTHAHTSSKHTRHNCTIYNTEGRKSTESTSFWLNQKQTNSDFQTEGRFGTQEEVTAHRSINLSFVSGVPF